MSISHYIFPIVNKYIYYRKYITCVWRLCQGVVVANYCLIELLWVVVFDLEEEAADEETDEAEAAVTADATVRPVKSSVRSDHRFSIRVEDHLKYIIIRNKETEPNQIEIEEFFNHAAIVNLALDMLDDCYEKEQ